MLAKNTSVRVIAEGRTLYEKSLCNKEGIVIGHNPDGDLNLIKFTDDEKSKHYFFTDEELEVTSDAEQGSIRST